MFDQFPAHYVTEIDCFSSKYDLVSFVIHEFNLSFHFKDETSECKSISLLNKQMISMYLKYIVYNSDTICWSLPVIMFQMM